MNFSNAITLEWQHWVDENLQRGCTADSMVAAMVAAGVPADQALSTITSKAVPVNTLTSMPTGDGYTYDRPRFNHTGNQIRVGEHLIDVTFRIDKPRVIALDNMLTHLECDELMRLSRLKLQRSTVVDPVTGTEAVISARSSDGTFFKLQENSFVAMLDQRIAALMQCPIENGEGLQVLRYGPGGEYKPHFDYFPLNDPGSAVHLAQGGQRVSTLVIYLNDVERGGETTFPRIGISVPPRKGAAVYFEYCDPHGQIDPLTLHGGAPVLEGEKWIATKWVRQGQYY